MGQTIGLKRLEAFEVKERLHHPHARGIAIRDRHDVRVKGFANRRVARNRVLERLPDQRGRHVAMIEPRRDTMRDRPFKRVVVEDANREKEPEFGLAPRCLLRFLADASEKRIAACDPYDPGG
jgi:hypothetical protein